MSANGSSADRITSDSAFLQELAARKVALGQELRSLSAEKAKIIGREQVARKKMDAIDALMTLEQPNGSAETNPPADAVRSRDRGPLSLLDPPGKGLREAIRAFFAASPGHAFRPKAVASRMRERGFREDGVKTSLETRVGSEMWRLARDGFLQRAAKGYRLTPADLSTNDTGREGGE